MSYKTTRKADQDIIDIYAHGVAEFGVELAERYHVGLGVPRADASLRPALTEAGLM